MAKGDKKKKLKGFTVMQNQQHGTHYSKHPIQPIEIAYLYNMTPGATLALRYLLRYRDKGGQADIQKLKHLIEMIEELEYKGQVEKLQELLKQIEDEENENPTIG